MHLNRFLLHNTIEVNFTDSQRSPQALLKAPLNTKRHPHISQILTLLLSPSAASLHIQLQWVPSHKGIPLNDKIVQLAKEAAMIGTSNPSLLAQNLAPHLANTTNPFEPRFRSNPSSLINQSQPPLSQPSINFLRTILTFLHIFRFGLSPSHLGPHHSTPTLDHQNLSYFTAHIFATIPYFSFDTYSLSCTYSILVSLLHILVLTIPPQHWYHQNISYFTAHIFATIPYFYRNNYRN